jgi:hypothetical protein
MPITNQPSPHFTETEVFLLFNILEHIVDNATRHKSEFVVSSCEFMFEIDYGQYSTFENVLGKVRSQALYLMMANHPEKK